MEVVENKRDGESSVCRRCSLVAARLCAAGDAQHLRTSSHQIVNLVMVINFSILFYWSYV